jgi:Skp family chaperone for outer membrane proteins
LDEVAEELGLRQEMDELLSDRQALLKSEVIDVQQQLQDALNKKIEEAGESPTEEQKKQLARLQLEATQRLRQAQTRATQLLNQHRASLIRQIRTKIKIPIDQVARDKGINMVVTEHPDFLIFTSGAADITSDVISAARKANLGGLDADKTDGDDGATDSPAPATGGDSADPK